MRSRVATAACALAGASLLCGVCLQRGIADYDPRWVTADQARTIVSAVLPGTFTVATLPPATNNQAKYAFVADLGGGADMVLSDGAYWKHIRQGVVTDVAATSSLTLTPLVSPPVIRLTGTNVTTTAANIATSNLYPGETFRVILPSGVLAALGSFGISVGGGSSLPLLGGTWADFMWNGTTLVKTAGGTL